MWILQLSTCLRINQVRVPFDRLKTLQVPLASNPLKCIGLPEGVQSSMCNKVQRYLENKSSYTKHLEYLITHVFLSKALSCRKNRNWEVQM